MALARPKEYIYQVFRSGRFLGVLQNVVSEFSYSQDIDSAGAQLLIEVDDTPDHSTDAPQVIQAEDGSPILTENNEPLLTEGTPDIVGNRNSNALIRNNNTIYVYEISASYPNGKLVFSGWISKWRATFGDKDTITINALSNGTELDNYIVEAVPTVDQSQTTYTMFGSGGSHALWGGLRTLSPVKSTLQWIAQTFTVGAGVSNLSAIELHLAADTTNDYCDVEIRVYNYDGSGIFTEVDATTIGTARRTVNSTADTAYTFTFTTPLTVVAGQQYVVTVRPILGSGQTEAYVQIGATGSNLYANGTALVTTSAADSSFYVPPPSGFFAGNDLYFRTYYSSGATSSPFNSQDPTTMLRTIIDNYVSKGGIINYGTGTTTLTSTTRSYTFKVNTVLEAIKKIADIAPYDWYWYVDPATNVIYFKQASTTADVTLIKGRHIQSLDIEANVENVKNKVYFTGGDVGGSVYLFQTYSDATALAANAGRVGLSKQIDNRVTLSDTASAIMQNYINSNKSEAYQTTCVVNDASYDTTLLTLGKVIGFSGWGNFVDNLLLQLVRIERHPDYVVLTLGVIPQRASVQVEEIQRQLDEAQTLYNPTTPS